MKYPLPLAGFDTMDLEKRIVDLIAERNTMIISDFLGRDHDPQSRTS